MNMRMKKWFRRLRFLSVFILIIVIAGVIWYHIPVKMIDGNDAHKITEIYLFDGNSGREMTFSDRDAVSFIVEELKDVRFKRDGLALGLGTSYHLKFMTDTGVVESQFILQTSVKVKKGIFFYTLWDDSKNFNALDVYLGKMLDWSQNETEPFPAPPQSKDFKVPNLPESDLLKSLYPLDTSQITLYFDRGEEGGYLTEDLSAQIDIGEVIENLKYSDLQAVVPADEQECEPFLYIDFHNGTVWACAEEPYYVWLGNQLAIEKDAGGNIISCTLSGDSIGPYGVKTAELSMYLSEWGDRMIYPSLWEKHESD